MNSPRRSSVAAALIAAGMAASTASHAVRINPDGHGQALIYPYYTARSSVSGFAFVTALTVINTANNAKALKVRFREGKAGEQVLTFNLFLSAYDVWTAGIIGADASNSSSTQAAGIFTLDNSCTSPKVTSSSAVPIRFRNGAYSAVDPFGDSLDRTYEGYFEVVEMGTIVKGSALELAVTQKEDFSAPNASKPPCTNLPMTGAVPAAAVLFRKLPPGIGSVGVILSGGNMDPAMLG